MFSNLWRIIWISMLALFALEGPALGGCGWGAFEPRNPHYLRPDLSGQFIPPMDGTDMDELSDDASAANIGEWMRQAPGATEKDVKEILFSEESGVFNALKALEKGEAYDGPLKGNVFVKQAFANKDSGLLSYAMFARRTEALTLTQDSWDYTAPKPEINLQLIEEARQGREEATSDFLRLRYGFQVVRLLFLNRDYKGTIQFFEKNLASVKDRSEVLEWSRSFYAGALYWSKRKDEAFVQFAQVFTNSLRYRQAALVSAGWALGLSFGDQEIEFGDRVETILNKAKTDAERISTLTLLAFFRTRFANFTQDPAAARAAIGLMKMRAEGVAIPDDVKMIAQLLVKRLEAAPIAVFNKTLPDLEPVVLALRDSEKGDDALFWGTISAYLAILSNDAETGRIRIAWVRRHDPSPLFDDQMKILDLMLAVRNANERSEDEAILSGLIWLATKSGALVPAKDNENEIVPGYALGQSGDQSDDLPSSESQWLGSVRHQMLLDLADHANPARSILFIAASERLRPDGIRWMNDFFFSATFGALSVLPVKDLDQLAAIFERPGSELEQFLTRLARPISPEAINEMKGAQQIRKGSFNEAVLSLSGKRSSLFFEWSPEAYILLAFSEPGRAFGSYSSIYGVGKLGQETPPENGILARTVTLSEKDALAATLPEGRSAEEIKKLVALVNAPTESRLIFAKQMEALGILKDLGGEAGAKAHYIYAKGLFNRTYFGEAWILSAWGWSSSEGQSYGGWGSGGRNYYLPAENAAGTFHSDVDKSQNAEFRASARGAPSDQEWGASDQDYYWALAANEAFRAAAEKSRDPEFQARALFMASFARQSRDRPQFVTENGKTSLAGAYFSDNPDFTRLKKDFSNTRFYEAAQNTCSFLKDFSPQ